MQHCTGGMDGAGQEWAILSGGIWVSRRLAASWKDAETLRAELKEEMMNRKHIMEDIRIKQQAIAAQESIISDHMSFRHAHEQQRIDMQRAMEAIEQEKAAIDKERMQMQVGIDSIYGPLHCAMYCCCGTGDNPTG